MSLYYVRNRWYDPEVGRFVNEDPIGHAGGENLYAFAGNDPVNASDPSGMSRDGCMTKWIEFGSPNGLTSYAYSYEFCRGSAGGGADNGTPKGFALPSDLGANGGGGGSPSVSKAGTAEPRDWGACGDVALGMLAVGMDVLTVGEATEAVDALRVGKRIFGRGLAKFAHNGNFLSRNVMRDIVSGIAHRNSGMAGLIGVAREFGQEYQLSAPLVTDAIDFFPIVGGLSKAIGGASACFHTLTGR